MHSAVVLTYLVCSALSPTKVTCYDEITTLPIAAGQHYTSEKDFCEGITAKYAEEYNAHLLKSFTENKIPFAQAIDFKCAYERQA